MEYGQPLRQALTLHTWTEVEHLQQVVNQILNIYSYTEQIFTAVLTC
jgi:hypothetical protein